MFSRDPGVQVGRLMPLQDLIFEAIATTLLITMQGTVGGKQLPSALRVLLEFKEKMVQNK